MYNLPMVKTLVRVLRECAVVHPCDVAQDVPPRPGSVLQRPGSGLRLVHNCDTKLLPLKFQRTAPEPH